MKLKELLNEVSYDVIQGDLDKEIGDVIYDSRIKTKQGLFIAIKGYVSDGHKYINQAIDNGVRVVVVSDEVSVNSNVTVIKVTDTRSVMAIIANNFYDCPSKKLSLVGVTGTNGKTSTTFILAQILEAYGKKVGVIGTIQNRIGDKILETARTTPEAIDLQNLFKRMAEEDVDTAIMEVSSHALDLNRVDMCDFNVGIFTNLTQDHLDFHHTMENYANAKAKLFAMCDINIINIDSDYAEVMLNAAKTTPITYGIKHHADFRAKDIIITANATEYTLCYADKSIDISVPIPGEFTVYNTVGALIAAYKLGVPMEFIKECLKFIQGVPGRIQSFNSKKGYSVIVDYAHTPDGLENVLEAITKFVKGKIITVFGCGGDRDNTKRPIMGEVASQYSDKVIITSDNPRSEEPQSIIDQIEAGSKKYDTPYTIQVDRKKAIDTALGMAKPGDVVLVAGKGHETYQHLKHGIIHFDDSEVVTEYLNKEV
ncbi:MAG: UDP-N-acetylmuramoyl-L-alanyl-D-glutamate--2,6-diaminopimelate ligase [Epulopiscium sp. Nuni2H_MBin003]|nr:MAG: UDP-N-acetylmuramoyl-L-alanyl-D-glutamate--2,6-diaminopimelate ligase [Epulopiscium sp. Nuni2H_MBin003]